ncbi:MAG: ATP-dependent DNA helicase DinG [Treponema sp.]|jgi:ATP-dependent DNA helicase DinG|nr:ATP-dependent DNA helicase DinG [Treponema sp.]
MVKLDSKKIIASLQEDGAVAAKLPSYELRKSQLDLLDMIIHAFNEKALLMAEAGTGVGKSFAYLLPAMHFALLNKEKVVISTATITLQEQLYEKDIPLVASTMGKEIKSILMKGRANYLCCRRLYGALEEGLLFDTDLGELHKIAEWTKNSQTGEKSQIPFMPSPNVWNSVCSESDLCLGSKCLYRDDCFVLKLRKKANSAHIIVANHHLLFADLAARYHGAGYEQSVVLPPFSHLVLDEAHTIESAATSFFSSDFARTGIFRQLSRLYNKKRGSEYGLLVKLSAMLPSSFEVLDSMADATQKIRESAEELDDAGLRLCNISGIYRLSASSDEDFLNKDLFPQFKKLQKNIQTLTGMVRSALENLEDDEAADPSIYEIKIIARRLDDIAEICGSFCNYKKYEDQVFWIERQDFSKNTPWVVFTRTPLDLAPILKDSVYAPNKTVCCVSATLAINNDFSYWASRTGFYLENRLMLSGCFPSPFPYSNAVLLAAPVDAPLPDEDGYQEFIDKAAAQLASVAGGSALVLFTSYQSLVSAHAKAKDELASLGIRCLKQGDDDRSRLLQDFVSDTNSCLFATSSFWEGVDAPGDTLRMVVICRLPFKTPGDPVLEARREAVEKRGGNPFTELSLPQAVMKFKQGFGRLMRRTSDHGIVVVLDGRILKKSYGRLFMESLPETKVSFGNMNSILHDIENFLY